MSQKRFYESDPITHQAVRQLFLFPDDIQTILANGICDLVERDHTARAFLHDAKTLGRDKILALYKSHRKVRSYDKNPAVHKAMNYLMLLDIENRQSIARQMSELIQCVQDYLNFCKNQGIEAETDDIQVLLKNYAERGYTNTQSDLKALKQALSFTVSRPG